MSCLRVAGPAGVDAVAAKAPPAARDKAAVGHPATFVVVAAGQRPAGKEAREISQMEYVLQLLAMQMGKEIRQRKAQICF